MKTPKEVALDFVEAINRHSPEEIMALMTEDHLFIDTYENIQSRAEIETGWPGYFAWFPDYRIEAEELLEQGDVVVVLGHAGGTYQGIPGRVWRLPAVWRVVVEGEKVKVWQVYCDSKIPYGLMEEGGAEPADARK